MYNNVMVVLKCMGYCLFFVGSFEEGKVLIFFLVFG